jgi:hypothetical protein
MVDVGGVKKCVWGKRMRSLAGGGGVVIFFLVFDPLLGDGLLAETDGFKLWELNRRSRNAEK